MKHLVAVAVVSVVLATGASAFAGGTFEDVPASHPFAEEIEAIAGAGITTGFPDGTYRPSGTVSRGAMAAFMARGFSSIGSAGSFTPIPLTSAGPADAIAQVTVDAGATEAGGGYVMLTGTATARTAQFADCPCSLELAIFRSGGSTPIASVFDQLPGDAGTITSRSDLSMAVTAAVPLAADATQTYVLQMGIQGVLDSGTTIEVRGNLTAIYAPFASSSGSTPVDPST